MPEVLHGLSSPLLALCGHFLVSDKLMLVPLPYEGEQIKPELFGANDAFWDHSSYLRMTDGCIVQAREDAEAFKGWIRLHRVPFLNGKATTPQVVKMSPRKALTLASESNAGVVFISSGSLKVIKTFFFLAKV